MSKYVLIGGAGVFAIHTARFLLNLKETTKVICVGRNIERGAFYHLDVGKNDKRYEYRQIHIVFEQDRLINLFEKEKPDYIINYAALAYATSWENSFRYYETNLISLVKMCEYLQDQTYLKKFIQIGTSELYGSVDIPADENYPISPTSPYAVSKLAGDLHLNTLFNVKKFKMNIVRPSNGYGEGQQVWRIIPKAILYGLTGRKFPLEGGGKVKKSYIHAFDLANAIYIIAKKGKDGEIYNVGSKTPVSIYNLIEIISRHLSISIDNLCYFVDGRVGEDKQYWLNSDKIMKELNWKESITLDQGIFNMIKWVKDNKKDLLLQEDSFTLRA